MSTEYMTCVICECKEGMSDFGCCRRSDCFCDCIPSSKVEEQCDSIADFERQWDVSAEPFKVNKVHAIFWFLAGRGEVVEEKESVEGGSKTEDAPSGVGKVSQVGDAPERIITEKYDELEADLVAIKGRIRDEYRHEPGEQYTPMLADLRLLLGILNLRTEFWQDAEKELKELHASTSDWQDTSSPLHCIKCPHVGMIHDGRCRASVYVNKTDFYECGCNCEFTSGDDWQDIATAPRDGTPILLAFPDGHIQQHVMKPEGVFSVWVNQAPTHWRHLPPPPSVSKPATATASPRLSDDTDQSPASSLPSSNQKSDGMKK